MNLPEPYLLVAEDDPSTAEVVCDLATALGWKAICAPNGEEALQLFHEREPDMMLLDYFMPKLNGLDVLSQVRKEKSQIPIIMMSAYSEEKLILESLRLGATDFLRKPFEHLSLLKAILSRENQRHQTSHIQKLAADRVVSQSIEYEFENDFSVASGICTHIAENMAGGENAYQVRLGLEELAANAIEHGNLGFTREEKTEALEQAPGEWTHRIHTRAQDPRYSQRRVRILASVENKVLEVTILDQGDGFDYDHIPDPMAEENILLPNGRGIFLSRLQFDVLEYIGRGNMVKVRKNIK